MQRFSNWTDLEPFGLGMLTGEACAYGYRVLCDLTEDGIKLVADCLGADPAHLSDSLPTNWNSRVNGKPATRSIMLAAAMFQPMAVFAAFAANCSKVYIMHTGTVYGVEAGDNPEMVQSWLAGNQGTFCEACDRYGKGGGVQYQYSNPGFSRNRHQMSGRTT